MSLTVKARMGHSGRAERHFVIDWRDIRLVYTNGFFDAVFRSEDAFFDYVAVLSISVELLADGLPAEFTRKHESLSFVHNTQGEYDLASTFRLPISNTEYHKEMHLDGLDFSFHAVYKGMLNKDENVNALLKRLREQDKNKPGYSDRPIKVFLGGSPGSR